MASTLPGYDPYGFFYWGHLKDRVYKNRPLNLDHLRERILYESTLITPEVLNNTIGEFYDRLGYCLANNGQHFEHLIR